MSTTDLADAPGAPPEPPIAGHIIYVSQMMTKLHHDNPHRHHGQILAVRRIQHVEQVVTQ
jgi:hypothetical protein